MTGKLARAMLADNPALQAALERTRLDDPALAVNPDVRLSCSYER